MTSDASDNPYVSEYPPTCTIDPSIKALISHYYQQVDTKGKHVEYSECWIEDGTLVVPNGQEFTGREAIRNLHSGMWDGVPRRLHRPRKVFPFGDNADEVVIIGTVEYWPEDGPYKKQDMAARAKYRKDSNTGEVKIVRLQVWLTG
ncbi:fungal specific transcription factor [Paraphaeosphaeria sporulosa]